MTDIYSGKTLDEWAATLSEGSPDAKQQAAEALGASGHAGAFDVLLAELDKPMHPPEKTVKFTTVNLLGESTEVDTDAAVRVAIVSAIGACGEQASRAVPRLCELLGRERTQKVGPMRTMIAIAMGDAALTNAIGQALAAIGQPAFPNVRELLQNASATVRSAAATSLGMMGPIARDAVPDLERLAFRDPYEATRTSAQRSLERLR